MTQATSATNDDLALAFVLLKGSEKPSAKKIIRAATALGLDLQVTEATDAGLSFKTTNGDVTAQVMTMGFPHPDALKTTSTGPTAITPAEARASSDHVMIVAHGLTGDTRERDACLARLTAAVIETMPAVGAMLGHGAVFHKARLFYDAMTEAPNGPIPPLLAVDVTMAPEPDARMSFMTHGMTRHGREDVYVTCPVSKANDAAQFILGLVRWMLTDLAKQFPTGDSIGRTPSERVRVQRAPHPNHRDRVLMRLDLP